VAHGEGETAGQRADLFQLLPARGTALDVGAQGFLFPRTDFAVSQRLEQGRTRMGMHQIYLASF
jgi:hypothetical protein